MVRDASSGSTGAAGWAHSHRIGMPADPVAIGRVPAGGVTPGPSGVPEHVGEATA